MNYVSTPFSYQERDSFLSLDRDLKSEVELLDSLIELVVFTPRGSFAADPDFGFEYWNHEYSNIHYRPFNNGQVGMAGGKPYQEITKLECQASIKRSLETYAPQLQRVSVSIELDAALNEKRHRRKVQSKHLVSVRVEGDLNDGIGTNHYKKDITFLMEPTAKRYL